MLSTSCLYELRCEKSREQMKTDYFFKISVKLLIIKVSKQIWHVTTQAYVEMESWENFQFPKFPPQKIYHCNIKDFSPTLILTNSKGKSGLHTHVCVLKHAHTYTVISRASNSLFPPPKSHFTHLKKTGRNPPWVSP